MNAILSAEESSHHPLWLYRFAALAALIQIVCVFVMVGVVSALGREPATAEEYYTLLREDRVTALLRMDFMSLINVSRFTITSFAIFTVLRKHIATYAALATALIYLGVALGLSTHSAASMLYLSEQYELATTELQQQVILTAGEAVIASDWWKSTGGFFAGIFLQGGMAFMSVLMLRSNRFRKVTAYAGLLSNGLDFSHVVVGLVLPSLAGTLIAIGGLFYLIWYPLLLLDFIRLGRGVSKWKNDIEPSMHK